MDSVDAENYRKAGEIARKVREWSVGLVKPGVKAFDLAEKIEDKILKEGGSLAFPVNVCINDVTAHYTPKYNDTTVLGGSDLVSIDLGVHVDGFIADTACSVDLSGKYSKLLECNKAALEESIKLVKPGVSVSRIGETVQSIITKAGFKPIENLTGHEVKKYDLHAGLAVPNIKVPYDWKIQEGMAIALEPFATNGYGRVVEAKAAEIFSILNDKPTRMREARILIDEVSEREGLPFALRWYAKKINPLKLNLIANQLVSEKILRSYPPLHEKEKGVVSQFEHTVLVTKDGCEVTT
ncbi:MAG: type II methionyl aminopeptidase [Candidatus Altiarchaeota archaeon]|nr:type II methionyl aminopeptidase [Candidatus Altiarchaeota archaeon]